MLFGEKIGSASGSENSSIRMNEQMDQFPFSALHFLRNRLMPSGKKLGNQKWIFKKIIIKN